MRAIWEDLINKNFNYEQSLDFSFKKDSGSFYTPLALADVMVDDIISSIEIKKLPKLKLLEPCVGTGNLIISYLKKIHELNFSKEDNISIFNNIYVCDVNPKALDIYKKNISLISENVFKIKLDKDYFDTHMGSALLFDLNSAEPKYISIYDLFKKEELKKGFDIIITNPPYKNLKAELKQYPTKENFYKTKEKYQSISKLAQHHLKYSTYGVLNIYKLFVEEIVEHYANDGAVISLLVPNSILTDKTCERLRNRIFNVSNLRSIITIPENNKFIDAKQSLCILNLTKGQKTNEIKIETDFPNTKKTYNFKLNMNSYGNAIKILQDSEMETITILNQFPKIKELNFIHNLRGELDLTMHKSNILVCQTSNFPLIRGRNVDYYSLKNISEYVNPCFIDKTSKKTFIQNERIACQQISNMAKERRLMFTYVPANMVLANSCNFISVDNNLFDVDIYFILGILNSNLINWFFKLSSSNNHVNNYEIGELPIPIEYEHKKIISDMVQSYMKTPSSSLLNRIEAAVCNAFGINHNFPQKTLNLSAAKKHNQVSSRLFNDLSYYIKNVESSVVEELLTQTLSIECFIMQYCSLLSINDINIVKFIIEKYQKLYNNEILNHTTFKLSNLDLEMIKDVPPGGSWKDIPSDVVNKSKRLLRITQTGGRTTLYGRIDYSKPSYTITTYFNRPGNGTYVHPSHERVISVREACRFQCLPDDYYITGNKTQMLKQVGNAVPTILAYLIGKKIRDVTNCRNSVDLFCGLGGLTYGFKMAGINSVLSTDIEQAFCNTLKVNNPEITVLCGDITQTNIKQDIIKKSINNEVDIICGGPPCQGFSLAGYRADNDSRNKLFKDFVEIVEKINPKVIVFENVEGLLSYQNGETYHNILQLFNKLNYNVEGRTLQTEEYAIPQKRKRVIIICTRKDQKYNPCDLFPKKITNDYITAKEAIYDLDNIECSESAYYKDDYSSDFIDLMKGKITYQAYLQIKSEK